MEKFEVSFFYKNLDKLKIENGKKLSGIVSWLELVLLNSGLKDKILMPKKQELAKLLHVGLGTIQNAYRCLEDKGLLISKQCIGTFYIADDCDLNFRKLTSKKDILVTEILNYFKNENFKQGDKISSVRFFANLFKSSTSIILQVFEQLENMSILEHINGDRFILTMDFNSSDIIKETLVDKVYKDLKNYIAENLKQGEKMPSVYKLAKDFSVSVKTVFSAIHKLQKEGILKTLSGRYGTVVIRVPNDKVFYQKPEVSIFASAQETYYYRYERILNIIKKMILDNFEVGSKLPSISELALLLDVNSNTIRKTFDVLREEGIVSSVRGRYGGTFVLELPDYESTQSYQWLAVTNDFTV